MIIRYAAIEDLAAVSEVERACFPPLEAASEESFKARLESFPNHFWLMFDGDKLVSFVDGFVTDNPELTDDMYSDASQHDENGAWQMIFGVNTLPEYRRQGLAGQLIRRCIEDARQQGRRGVVLTCKQEKIHYYERFGFVFEGVSDSVHGNVEWNKMRLTF